MTSWWRLDSDSSKWPAPSCMLAFWKGLDMTLLFDTLLAPQGAKKCMFGGLGGGWVVRGGPFQKFRHGVFKNLPCPPPAYKDDTCELWHISHSCQ
jgi:hypothetical protein